MGQACSLCDSDRQTEVNLDELNTSAVSESSPLFTELLERKKAREKKAKHDSKGKKDKTGREKKEKKSSKGKKETQAMGQAREPGPTREESPGVARSPQVASLRSMLPSDKSAPCVATAGAEQEAEARRQSTGPWHTLPSVGTWLKPLPRMLATRTSAIQEVGAAVLSATTAAQAEGPFKSIEDHTDSVDSFVALAVSVAEADSQRPSHEQPDLMADLFECFASDKVLAPLPALEEAPGNTAVPMSFLEEVLTWPSANKDFVSSEEFAVPSAEKPLEASPAHEDADPSEQPAPPQQCTGAAPLWYLRPSVGTWLCVKHHLPTAARAEELRSPASQPCPLPGAAGTASALAAGSATVTTSGCGDPAAGMEVTYGLEPALPWKQEAPIATRIGDTGSAACTTTLAGGPPRSTTAEALPRRIISM